MLNKKNVRHIGSSHTLFLVILLVIIEFQLDILKSSRKQDDGMPVRYYLDYINEGRKIHLKGDQNSSLGLEGTFLVADMM